MTVALDLGCKRKKASHPQQQIVTLHLHLQAGIDQKRKQKYLPR